MRRLRVGLGAVAHSRLSTTWGPAVDARLQQPTEAQPRHGGTSDDRWGVIVGSAGVLELMI